MDVLQRLIDVTCFLGEHELSFRGHNEASGSANRESYMDLLSFLAKYDDTLKNHFIDSTTFREKNNQQNENGDFAISVGTCRNNDLDLVIQDLDNSQYSNNENQSTSDATAGGVKRKRVRVSAVWKYFRKSSDKKFAKCINCGQEYKSSGNTSNLADHLRRHHPLIKNRTLNEETASSSATGSSSLESTSTSSSARSNIRSISPFFKRAIQYETTSQRKIQIDKAILEIIALDFQPFTIVKDKGFKRPINLLDPSNVAMEMFKKEQGINDSTTHKQYKLIQEVPTRWNSTYYMVERILTTSEALGRTLLKIRKAPHPLSVDELSILTDSVKVLKCFEEATKKISGSTYTTISLIIPLSFGIYNFLTTVITDLDTEEGKIFCSGLIESVKKRLFPYETRSVTKMGTIIDTRFKKEVFRSTENAASAAAILEQEMQAIYRKNTIERQNRDVEQESVSQNVKKSPSLFSFLENRVTGKNKISGNELAPMKDKEKEKLEHTIPSNDVLQILMEDIRRTENRMEKKVEVNSKKMEKKMNENSNKLEEKN
ncbi:unnamed protein product [Psylliodes chrysocephalus]|uniref:BED-type domain-containing protein n=1 Tax=Psylliodes chrysocephalus TaxID=3402493 RepID=A0A9P0D1R2_9CUCU|nr:unnamed protein product [Psylliodes chrysocephala]